VYHILPVVRAMKGCAKDRVIITRVNGTMWGNVLSGSSGNMHGSKQTSRFLAWLLARFSPHVILRYGYP
jgi:hypothetical protein